MKFVMIGWIAILVTVVSCRDTPNESSSNHFQSQEIYTQAYKVTPHAPESNINTGDPFPAKPSANIDSARTLKERMQDLGITFPKGAMVTNRGLPYAGILMRNTSENFEALERHLTDTFGTRWKKYDIEQP